MRLALILLVSLLASGCAVSQQLTGLFTASPAKMPGDAEYDVGNYRYAMQIYLDRANTETENGSLLNRIGEMYAKGEGVAKDEEVAIEWFHKAAEQGNAEAKTNLGAGYLEGEGVPKDEQKAMSWFRKAAEQGNRGGRLMLDWMYAGGRGMLSGVRRLVSAGSDTEPEQNAAAATSQARPDGLVTSIQIELNSLGYGVGPADGLIGRRTRGAIRAFQESHGIAADGEASPNLLIEISKAHSPKSTSLAVRHTQKPSKRTTPGKRVALVIGNGDYRNTAPLGNPKRDANAIAAKLRALDFRVAVHTDLDSRAMRNALRDFRRQLRGSDLSLFYYAGHAVQLDGHNFLLPVNAQIEEEADLRYDAVTLDAVMSEMEKSSSSRILILDACRDNPFVTQLASAKPRTRSANLTRGLAITRRDTVGTLIAYATSPDKVADDGVGAHSPYTAALINWIDRPRLEIGELFRRVREEVIRVTNRRQIPWENSSLVGDGIYLASFE